MSNSKTLQFWLKSGFWTKMRPLGSPDKLETRRKKAIRLLDKGWAAKKVAEEISVSFQTVYIWRSRFDSSGIDGIVAIKHEGPPSKLSARKKQKLAESLEMGAKAHGFETDVWTGRRVAKIIKRQFRVEFDASHLGRVLHSMGFVHCRLREPTDRILDDDTRYAWRQLATRKTRRSRRRR